MNVINWRLVAGGINHKTSSLSDREPLQIGRDELAGANSLFGNLEGVIESVVLSTCNRVEFYFLCERRRDAFDPLRKFFAEFKNIDIAPLSDKFYLKKNKHAADHLFRVAAGLDSMVIGENQILSQLKETYSSACAVKSAGKVIHRLFHQAFRVGKQIRTDTEMGQGACSVSSAALELLKDRAGSLHDKSILFIGLNQMISLAATALHKGDHGRFIFANRTLAKAEQFAARYGAEARGLEALPTLLAQADIVISCTGAQAPVVSTDILGTAARQRGAGKIIIIDMAIPRDFEADKGVHRNIELYDLEDIKKSVRQQQARRELAIPQAEDIIDRRLSEFNYWYDHARHEPAYNGLGDAFENIRRETLDELMVKLPVEYRHAIDRATENMIERLLKIKVRSSSNTK